MSHGLWHGNATAHTSRLACLEPPREHQLCLDFSPMFSEAFSRSPTIFGDRSGISYGSKACAWEDDWEYEPSRPPECAGIPLCKRAKHDMMLVGDQYANGAQQISQAIVPIEGHNTVLHSS
jgi:hypothetical protein